MSIRASYALAAGLVQTGHGEHLRLNSYCYFEHASHHDKPGDARRRFVIGLSRHVRGEEWEAFWATSVLKLGVPADRAAKDASRLYFLPTRPSDSDYFFEAHNGVPLDVDAMLASAAMLVTSTNKGEMADKAPGKASTAVRRDAIGDDFYVAVKAMDQGDLLVAISGTTLVAGQKIELGQPNSDGHRAIIIDERTTSGFIDGQGLIAQSDKGTSNQGPDGGPYATSWLRHSDYGNSNVDIRKKLPEYVAQLKRFQLTDLFNGKKAQVPSLQLSSLAASGSDVGESPPTTRSSTDEDDWVVESDNPMRLAQLIARKVCTDAAGRWTWAPWCGAWWEWDSTRYVLLSDDAVNRVLWLSLDLVEIVKHRKKGGSHNESLELSKALVGNVLAALTALARPIEGAAPQWRDSTTAKLKTLVPCQNGILDMESKTLFPATPNLFATTAVQTVWDPNAPAPVAWLKFLNEIFAEDDESIDTLQMMMAYLISNETGLQKIFALIGPKRSGKSTIERIIVALLDSAVTSPSINGLAERFGLAPLIGKSVAIISDCRISGRLDHTVAIERLLTITGEGWISIDRKNKDIIDVRLGTRFLLISNMVPGLGDPGGAMASRFIVLTTKQSFFGKEDLELEPRLLGELPSIFRWVVEGWAKLKAAGRFPQPAASAEMVADLEALGSPVAEFVAECCEVVPDATVAAQALYARYAQWCKRTGRLPLDDAGFGAALRAVIPQLSKFRPGSGAKRQRHYKGVRLA